jgi:hypothetical protein
MLVTARPSCSTSLGAASSKPKGGSTAGVGMGLLLLQRLAMMIYLLAQDFLITASVGLMQIGLATALVLKVAGTC